MSFGNITPQKTDITFDNWLQILEKPLPERNIYKIDDNSLNYSQVVALFLGTMTDNDDYYNMLYDLKSQQQYHFHLLSEEFDKTITNEKLQAITELIDLCQKEGNISINRFVAFLKGRQLISLESSPVLHRHIQQTLIFVLKDFQSSHARGFANQDFRRIIIDIVKCMFNHVEKWYSETWFKTEVPRIMWYGNATESKAYVLYFLIRLGWDVVIFHPDKTNLLAKVSNDNYFIYEYPESSNCAPFPNARILRKATVAHRASLEYERMLNQEVTGFFKPWQLREYTPLSLKLKTTYDEVFLLAESKAFVRPDFEAKNMVVRIPSIFCKISGISINKKEYWSRMQKLVKTNLSICIRQFPFTVTNKSNFLYHYKQSINKDGHLSVDKIISQNCWQYQKLPTWLQKGLAETLIRYCTNPKLKKLPYEKDEDLKAFLFKQAMFIPEEVLKLLQRFDYGQDIPKVVIYNNGNTGELTRTDASLLLFLNEMGCDVIVCNPGGLIDLENYIDDENFDHHWLDEMYFDQEFELGEQSVFNIFKKVLGTFR